MDYLPGAVDAILAQVPDGGAGVPFRRRVRDVRKDLLVYALRPGPEPAAQASQDIKVLRDSPVPQGLERDVGALLAHAAVILRYRPEVDGALDELLAVPAEARYNAFHDTLHAGREQKVRAASEYRLVLVALSAALAARHRGHGGPAAAERPRASPRSGAHVAAAQRRAGGAGRGPDARPRPGQRGARRPRASAKSEFLANIEPRAAHAR